MAYFETLPKTTFLNQEITNLAVGVKLNRLVKENSYAMLNYILKDGDRPENIAHDYYGDTTYAWLVLLSNQILDPYYQWPLQTYDFEQFLIKKYGSIATAKATTIHCEHKTKNITIAPDSLSVSNGVSSSNFDAIDAYTYWDRINENRRNIKLIHRGYLNSIDTQLKNIMA